MHFTELTVFSFMKMYNQRLNCFSNFFDFCSLVITLVVFLRKFLYIKWSIMAWNGNGIFFKLPFVIPLYRGTWST